MPFAILARMIHIYSAHYLISLAFFHLHFSVTVDHILYRNPVLLFATFCSGQHIWISKWTIHCCMLASLSKSLNWLLFCRERHCTLNVFCILHVLVSCTCSTIIFFPHYKAKSVFFSIVVTLFCLHGFNFSCPCSQFKNYSKKKILTWHQT